MPMLRRIDEPTQGNKQAWTNTYAKIWMKATDFLQKYPNKVDSSVAIKKRAPNQTLEYELEVSSLPPTTPSCLICVLI